MVETEPVGIIPGLPSLRPYDVCITLGHAIANSPYKTLLSCIGFDVTVPNPLLVPLRVPPLWLLIKINLKCVWEKGNASSTKKGGKTNKKSMITLSGENVFQQINNMEDAFITSPYVVCLCLRPYYSLLRYCLYFPLHFSQEFLLSSVVLFLSNTVRISLVPSTVLFYMPCVVSSSLRRILCHFTTV